MPIPTLLKQLKPQEKPRERCLLSGTQCLSLRECLAILLGSGPPGIGALGLAHQILNRPGTGLPPAEEEIAFFTALECSGRSHLLGIPGLGLAGQSRILAAFELGRRYSVFRSIYPIKKKAKTTSLAQLAQAALQQIPKLKRAAPQEWMGFVPIHRTGLIGEFCVVAQGTRHHVHFDVSELFARILVSRPTGFFLCHNHPNEHVQPSPEDMQMTQRVHQLASALNVCFLGHWIVSAHHQHWLFPHAMISSS